METPPELQVDADRPVLAAETALWAANKFWKQGGGFRPYPSDLMGGADQPECLRGFTRWEIERASEFLVCLGLIEKPRRGQRAARAPTGIRGDAPRDNPAP